MFEAETPAGKGLDVGVIGLEEVHDGVWNLIYYGTLLRRFDERTNAMTGAPSTRRGC
jgi:hypothetical protein